MVAVEPRRYKRMHVKGWIAVRQNSIRSIHGRTRGRLGHVPTAEAPTLQSGLRMPPRLKGQTKRRARHDGMGSTAIAQKLSKFAGFSGFLSYLLSRDISGDLTLEHNMNYVPCPFQGEIPWSKSSSKKPPRSRRSRCS